MKILLALIGISAGLFLLMIGILWFIRKKQEKEYDQDYIFVAGCIRYWAISPQTYHRIIDMLTKLSLDKANDTERTKQLYQEFRAKFSEYDLGVQLEKKDVLINQN